MGATGEAAASAMGMSSESTSMIGSISIWLVMVRNAIRGGCRKGRVRRPLMVVDQWLEARCCGLFKWPNPLPSSPDRVCPEALRAFIPVLASLVISSRCTASGISNLFFVKQGWGRDKSFLGHATMSAFIRAVSDSRFASSSLVAVLLPEFLAENKSL